MAEYQEFRVNHLASMEELGQVQSSFVMSEIKHSTGLRLVGNGNGKCGLGSSMSTSQMIFVQMRIQGTAFTTYRTSKLLCG